MTDRAERPNRFPLPPAMLVGTLALCFLLDTYLPLGWEPEQVGTLMRSTGWMLIILALALDVWAALTLRRHKTTIRPDRAAKHLVRSGPFRFSRNPIYLGNVMIVTGVGFALGSRWFVIGAVVMFFLLQELAIKREEQHLKARFGADWDTYAAKTRRWI